MNFIQKLIQQKKLEKELQFRRTCSRYINRVEDNIYYLKDAIKRFSNSKTYTEDDILEIKTAIELLEYDYSRFLYDLKDAEFTHKNTYYKYVKANCKQQAEYMHKLKKQYRVEFEIIYNNFRRATKGYNFPGRNEMLGSMRKAFDFDSSKYYQKNIVHEIW